LQAGADSVSAEIIAEKMLDAFDTVTLKDTLDLKVMVGSRGGADLVHVCVSLMKLLAGLNVNSGIVVDAEGKATEPTRKGVLMMLGKFNSLRAKMKTLTLFVDEGKMPEQNIEEARLHVQEMGNHFSHEQLAGSSNLAAAEICTFVTNSILYYDSVSAGSDVKAADLILDRMKVELGLLSKKELSMFRMETPPELLQQPFIAVMHFFAGLDIDSGVSVDSNGDLQDTSWEAADKMLKCPEKFILAARELVNHVHPDKMPSRNIEGARATLKKMGEHLDRKEPLEWYGTPCKAELGLRGFLKYSLMYYDALVATRL
jgi:hypothetical protein